MKITKQRLKEIIKEEIAHTLNETNIKYDKDPKKVAAQAVFHTLVDGGFVAGQTEEGMALGEIFTDDGAAWARAKQFIQASDLNVDKFGKEILKGIRAIGAKIQQGGRFEAMIGKKYIAFLKTDKSTKKGFPGVVVKRLK
jgi:hypothetical protein